MCLRLLKGEHLRKYNFFSSTVSFPVLLNWPLLSTSISCCKRIYFRNIYRQYIEWKYTLNSSGWWIQHNTALYSLHTVSEIYPFWNLRCPFLTYTRIQLWKNIGTLYLAFTHCWKISSAAQALLKNLTTFVYKLGTVEKCENGRHTGVPEQVLFWCDRW